jgi:two-component system phosphate regulon response regulator PhoB
MNNKQILVVDDEEDILELVRFNLTREGHQVFCADSGEKAVEIMKSKSVDLMVLDLMLPGMDGFAVAKWVKNNPLIRHVPIIMLTAKGSESDVVAGLELGAEDYVTKPFSPRILVARIHKVLHRAAQVPAEGRELIQRDNITIDVRKHQVSIDGEPAVLTYTEFEILTLLAGRPGWAFSRSQIVDSVRGYNYSVTDRSVDVQIVGLRRKLGAYGRYIQTVRGVGYRFKDDAPPTGSCQK